MEEEITIEEINNHMRDLKKSNKNADSVLVKLRHERERVRIGFLGGETPRLMALLTESIETLEYQKSEAKVLIKKFLYQRREIKRLRRLIKEHETPTPKPVPLIKKEPKRAKKKRKATGTTFTPSRKHQK